MEMAIRGALWSYRKAKVALAGPASLLRCRSFENLSSHPIVMEAMHFSLGPTLPLLHALAEAVDKRSYVEALVEPRVFS
jgi:hypothetical protein